MAKWKTGVPTRRELWDAKRDAVLREASISFNLRGFHGTSLEDVAQRLGVTKAALYYYFPTKQAVLKACFDLVMDAAFEGVQRARESGLSGLEKVKIVLGSFLEYLIDDLSVSVMLMEEDALSEADVATVKARRDAFERELRGFVREGIKDGSIVPCDPKLAVFMLLGAVAWVTRWFKKEGDWTSAQMSAAATEMLGRMLTTTPTPALTTTVGGRRKLSTAVRAESPTRRGRKN